MIKLRSRCPLNGLQIVTVCAYQLHVLMCSMSSDLIISLAGYWNF